MGSIKDMLITQVIQSGIKWMLSLLSPASALVKAVLAIVDVVKFFTQRASQVLDLVQAFVILIENGGIAGNNNNLIDLDMLATKMAEAKPIVTSTNCFSRRNSIS